MYFTSGLHGHVVLSFSPAAEGGAHGVNAGYEFAIFSNHVIDRFAHTRHVFHIGHHIRAVSDFNPDVRNV